MDSMQPMVGLNHTTPCVSIKSARKVSACLCQVLEPLAMGMLSHCKRCTHH